MRRCLISNSRTLAKVLDLGCLVEFEELGKTLLAMLTYACQSVLQDNFGWPDLTDCLLGSGCTRGLLLSPL